MKEITRKQAESRNLKLIGNIALGDMSKAILLIERLKENKKINYYVVELIVFNQNTNEGEIQVSFWGE
ncbi:MAG: hypothetical protein WC979_06320 [Candidatus Pacearchaeota archaeon]|jgi:hypothetical protein